MQGLKNLEGANHGQSVGVNIARRAMKEPARQIVANSGDEPSVILKRINQGSGNFGYNAVTEEFGDMIDMVGILDPTKVARSALQNAASVAALF